MYSQNDIETAVTSGAISAESALALREHVAATRRSPPQDDESFGLFSGYADYMIMAASLFMVIGLGVLGYGVMQDAPKIAVSLTGLLIAAGSWGLAEYFAVRRGMKLTGIFLTFPFAIGVCVSFLGLFVSSNSGPGSLIIALIMLLSAAVTWFFWARLRIPNAPAMVATFCVIAVIVLLATGSGDISMFKWIMLLCGIGVFFFAMWWDSSDTLRKTNHADIGFWLHLLAAPLIVQPIMQAVTSSAMQRGMMEGMMNRSEPYSRYGDPTQNIYRDMAGSLFSSLDASTSIVVILLSILFAAVALVLDRRVYALSGVFILFIAILSLFGRHPGVIAVGIALIVTSGFVLLLAARWTTARAKLLAMLPESIRNRVPPAAGEESVTIVD